MSELLIKTWRIATVLLMFFGPQFMVVKFLMWTGISDTAVAILGLMFSGAWLLSLMKFEQQAANN